MADHHHDLGRSGYDGRSHHRAGRNGVASALSRARAFVVTRPNTAMLAIGGGVACCMPTWLVSVVVTTAAALTVILISPVSTPVLRRLSAVVLERSTEFRYAGVSMDLLDEKEFPDSAAFESVQKGINLLVRDSVRSWYDEFSKDNELPSSAESVLERAAERLAGKLFSIDRYKLGTDLLEVFYHHVRYFNESRLATGGTGANGFGPSEEALVTHFDTSGGAHPALKSTDREFGYLFEAGQTIIRSTLSKKECGSDVLVHVLSRFLVSSCFVPVLDLATDSDFLNQLIVRILTEDPETDEESSAPKHDKLDLDSQEDVATVDSATGMLGSNIPDSNEAEAMKGEDGNRDLKYGFLEQSQPLPSANALSQAKWRTKWFVLTARSLQYYSDAMKNNLTGEIPLRTCSKVVGEASSPSKKFVFGLVCHDCTIFFAAGNEATRKQWVEQIDELVTIANKSIIAKSLSLYEDPTIPKYTVSVKRYEKMLHHAEYLLVVKLERDGGDSATSWELTRRYSEFLRLHRLLQARYSDKIRRIQFPTTTETFSLKGLDSARLETRRVHLDNYLQAIVQYHEIGCSYELCQFLSYDSDELFSSKRRQDKKGMMYRVAKLVGREVSSLAESVGKRLPFRRKKRWFNCIAPATFVFVRKNRGQVDEEKSNPFKAYLKELKDKEETAEDGCNEEAKSSSARSMQQLRGKIPDDTPSLVLDILFELTGYRQWLHRHPGARNIVLKFASGAISRFYQKELDTLVTEEMWEFYIDTVIKAVWDEAPPVVRTSEMKAREQGEAFRKIGELLPPILKKVCTGEGSYVDSAIMCFLSCLHFERLNRHLIVGMLDVFLVHVLHDEFQE